MSDVLRPSNEAGLAEMVRAATGPLALRGGGTKDMQVAGQALCLSGLSGIKHYEPEAMTLVAGAGTPMAEISAALAEHNQRLAFEPADLSRLLGTEGTPTLGAVAAMNNAGPRRVQAGAARDHMLGVRFVDGAGQIIKNGGRVMKNVTGYDLVRLMAGAHGTLGILTEIAFRVLPSPQTQATLAIEEIDVNQAVQAMAAALGSPFEVSGAAYDAQKRAVYLRVEGFTASVAYRRDRLAELLAPYGAAGVVAGRQASRIIWEEIRDAAIFADAPGDVWRLSLRPSELADILSRAGAAKALADWGGGRLWLLVPPGTDLRAKLGAFSGHATLMRGSADAVAALGRFHPDPAPVAALSAGLRAKFDPRGILNAGLMAR